MTEWNGGMECANGSVAEWNARTKVWRNGMRERKCHVMEWSNEMEPNGMERNEMRERNEMERKYNISIL